MKIVTAEIMKNEDSCATEVYKIPSELLMENAGSSLVEILKREIGIDKRFVVVIGGGNNGGDGFVIARRLFCSGAEVAIFKAFDEGKLTEASRLNYNSAKALDIPYTESFDDADVIIDCLLGIGIRGNVNPYAENIINNINTSGKIVVSADIPSGIDADNGRVCGKGVFADITVTFGYGKPGLYTGEGLSHSGKVFVTDISLPKNDSYNYFLTDEEYIKSSLPNGNILAHKGDNGTVLVVAGSKGMTGAAYLTCMGALKSGAGIVKLMVPSNLNEIMEIKLTEAMSVPTDDIDFFTLKSIPAIKKHMEKASVLAIGPGLGRNEQTVDFVHKLIKGSDVPMVIDADGIYALSMNIDILKEAKAPVILTPHPGEFSMLSGFSPDEINNNRVSFAKEFAEKYNVTLLLKGAGTVIACPDGKVYINPTGNEGMAKGGSGDVLTGIISSLLAKGAENPAAIGAYLHGKAGDKALEKIGVNAMLPTDFLKYL